MAKESNIKEVVESDLFSTRVAQIAKKTFLSITSLVGLFAVPLALYIFIQLTSEVKGLSGGQDKIQRSLQGIELSLPMILTRIIEIDERSKENARAILTLIDRE